MTAPPPLPLASNSSPSRRDPVVSSSSAGGPTVNGDRKRSPAASSSLSTRAAQLLAAVVSTWATRSVRGSAEVSANLYALLVQLLPLSKHISLQTLHLHQELVISAVETAAGPSQPYSSSPSGGSSPSAPAPASAKPATEGTVTPASSVPTASGPPALVAAPYVPPPHVLTLFLRLLRLQASRLPTLYRETWERCAREQTFPQPGLDVDSFLVYFVRVRQAGESLLDARLPPSGKRSPAGIGSPPTGAWDGPIAAIALHLQLLALYHSPLHQSPHPGSSFGEEVSAFWQRFEQQLLPHAWFGQQFRLYDEAKDALTVAASLLHNAGDLDRSGRIVLAVVRAWCAPDSTPPPPPSALNIDPRVAPHDSSFTVRALPPTLQQHETLQNFVALMVDSCWWEERKRAAAAAEPPAASEPVATPLQVHPFTVRLLAALVSECQTQFDSARSRAVHRVLVPYFALLGALRALDGTDEQAAMLQTEDIHPEIVRARAALKMALRFVLVLPEVRNMASPPRIRESATASKPTGSGLEQSAPRQSWPCCSPTNTACPSCLFVLLASAAVMHGARYAVQPAGAAVSPPDENLLTASWLLARAFMQLLDVTFVLHGTIAPVFESPSTSPTPPPTPVAPAARSSVGVLTDPSLPSSLPLPPRPDATPQPTPTPPAAPSGVQQRPPTAQAERDRLRTGQLLAWSRSPYYRHLPAYTRALATMFCSLRDRDAELDILAFLWQKLKYMHIVWRWYGLHCSREKSTVAGSLGELGSDPAARAKVNQRIRAIATMQPTDNHVDLPGDASADTPVNLSAGRLQLCPSTINSALLRRTHSTLFMSLTTLFGAIVKHDEWRGDLGFAASSAPHLSESGRALPSGMPAAQARVSVNSPALSSDALKQSFQFACMFDCLSLLEFSFSFVFGAHKELMAMLLAIATGQEVVRPPTIKEAQQQENQQLSTQAIVQPLSPKTEKKQPFSRALAIERKLVEHNPLELFLAGLYRKAFAHSILSFFCRCFFQPRFGFSDNGQVDLGPSVPRLLGMERWLEQAVTACQRWCGLRVPASSVTGTVTTGLYAGALPHPTSLAAMLAQSGMSFAPALLSHPDLRFPTMDAPWPPRCKELHVYPTTSFPPADQVQTARDYFLAGFFHGSLTVTRWEARWHFVLPWAWQRMRAPRQELSQRVHLLLAALLATAYEEATDPVRNDFKPVWDAVSCGSPLPQPPKGAKLEAYVRQLIPFWVSSLLDQFPSPCTVQTVRLSLITVFSTLPPTDLLLLDILRRMRDRAAQMLDKLMANERSLERWRQITDLLDEYIEAETAEDDATSTSPATSRKKPVDASSPPSRVTQKKAVVGVSLPPWLHPLPPNVRYPSRFPTRSIADALGLLSLVWSFAQKVDAALFPRALRLLKELLEGTLDPVRYPVATPLRASIVGLWQAQLARRFDLYKRDEAVDWLLDTVTQLSIPVGIKPPPAPKLAPRQGKDAFDYKRSDFRRSLERQLEQNAGRRLS